MAWEVACPPPALAGTPWAAHLTSTVAAVAAAGRCFSSSSPCRPWTSLGSWLPRTGVTARRRMTLPTTQGIRLQAAVAGRGEAVEGVAVAADLDAAAAAAVGGGKRAAVVVVVASEAGGLPARVAVAAVKGTAGAAGAAGAGLARKAAAAAAEVTEEVIEEEAAEEGAAPRRPGDYDCDFARNS